METLENILVQLETKVGDVNDERGTFKGYASVFGSIDLGGDTVSKGAFEESLSEWKAAGRMPQMLYYHDDKEIIGEWTEMKEDEKGLYVEGRLWIKGDEALESSRKAYNILRSNSVKGLSIGYRALEVENMELMDGTVIRNLKKIKLFEVSIAPWSMEPKAEVLNVKQQKPDGGDGSKNPTKREIEKVLRDSGLCSKKQAQAIVSKGYNSTGWDDSENEPSEAWTILESLNSISSILER